MDEVVMHVPLVFVDPYRDLDGEKVKAMLPWTRCYFMFSRRCDNIATDPLFQGFITLCIVMASTMVGFQVTYESKGTHSLYCMLEIEAFCRAQSTPIGSPCVLKNKTKNTHKNKQKPKNWRTDIRHSPQRWYADARPLNRPATPN
jgi:hypothetical protein